MHQLTGIFVQLVTVSLCQQQHTTFPRKHIMCPYIEQNEYRLDIKFQLELFIKRFILFHLWGLQTPNDTKEPRKIGYLLHI